MKGNYHPFKTLTRGILIPCVGGSTPPPTVPINQPPGETKDQSPSPWDYLGE
jgi:hypothetical protein